MSAVCGKLTEWELLTSTKIAAHCCPKCCFPHNKLLSVLLYNANLFIWLPRLLIKLRVEHTQSVSIFWLGSTEESAWTNRKCHSTAANVIFTKSFSCRISKKMKFSFWSAEPPFKTVIMTQPVPCFCSLGCVPLTVPLRGALTTAAAGSMLVIWGERCLSVLSPFPHPQLVANHVERIRQEETCPHKVMSHVKELAEQLFKNVCTSMHPFSFVFCYHYCIFIIFYVTLQLKWRSYRFFSSPGEPVPGRDHAQSHAAIGERPEPCAEPEDIPRAGRGCRATLHRPRHRKVEDGAPSGQGGAQGHGALWAPTGWVACFRGVICVSNTVE